MSIDLDAIQARADRVAELRKAFHTPQNSMDYSQRDVPALLAYARDLEARVGRVEAVTSRNALMDIIADAYGDKNQGHLSLVAADSIRAALTATDTP